MKKAHITTALALFMLSSDTLAMPELPTKKVKCSVEVISSFCASGVVSIVFDQNTFELNNGDVHCWFTDFKVSGDLENARPDFRGDAFRVDLISNGSKIEPALIGHLTYRPSKHSNPALAKLETSRLAGQGVLAGLYHMRCEELNEDLK